MPPTPESCTSLPLDHQSFSVLQWQPSYDPNLALSLPETDLPILFFDENLSPFPGPSTGWKPKKKSVAGQKSKKALLDQEDIQQKPTRLQFSPKKDLKLVEICIQHASTYSGSIKMKTWWKIVTRNFNLWAQKLFTNHCYHVKGLVKN